MKRERTKEENKIIRRMVKEGSLYHEVAGSIGISSAAVAIRARKMGVSSRGAYLKKQGGYFHRIDEIFELFKTHTATEVAKKMKLTEEQVRSALHRAYTKHPDKYKSKDERRKDSWSTEELIFLLQYSGLQERAWISKRLNRGTMQSVKEVVSRMSSTTRYLNGLPQKLAEIVLQTGTLAIKSKAGAPGPQGDCKTNIVPWVVMAAMLKRKGGPKLPATVTAGIEAMAKFQTKFQGGRSLYETAFIVASRSSEV